MTEQEQRDAVIAEAKTWLRTPFHHMGRVKGVGVDCGELLSLVYANAGVIPENDPGFYRFQHHLNSNTEEYIGKLLPFTREISEAEVKPADIVIYKAGRTFSHAAIIIDPWPGKIIHAVVFLGVVWAHGTKDGWLTGRLRRYFTPWGPTHVSR